MWGFYASFGGFGFTSISPNPMLLLFPIPSFVVSASILSIVGVILGVSILYTMYPVAPLILFVFPSSLSYVTVSGFSCTSTSPIVISHALPTWYGVGLCAGFISFARTSHSFAASLHIYAGVTANLWRSSILSTSFDALRCGGVISFVDSSVGVCSLTHRRVDWILQGSWNWLGFSSSLNVTP